MKQLVTTATFLVAIALAAPSAYALSAAQKAAVKKAVRSVPVPEMPAKVAELVLKADKATRSEIAAEAVRQAIYKSRSSAPQIVAAVSKAAPEVAGVASMTAVQMEGDQASLIAQAATTAAPSSRLEIASSVRSGLLSSSSMTVASGPVHYTSGGSSSNDPFTRGSYGGNGGNSVFQTKTPINPTMGGAGNGQFPNGAPNSAGPGQIIDYTKPRTK